MNACIVANTARRGRGQDGLLIVAILDRLLAAAGHCSSGSGSGGSGSLIVQNGLGGRSLGRFREARAPLHFERATIEVRLDVGQRNARAHARGCNRKCKEFKPTKSKKYKK
jgi:hypothetical protein